MSVELLKERIMGRVTQGFYTRADIVRYPFIVEKIQNVEDTYTIYSDYFLVIKGLSWDTYSQWVAHKALGKVMHYANLENSLNPLELIGFSNESDAMYTRLLI